MLKCLGQWIADLQAELLGTMRERYSALHKLVFTLEPALCRKQAKCVGRLIVATAGSHSSPLLEAAKLDVLAQASALVPL